MSKCNKCEQKEHPEKRVQRCNGCNCNQLRRLQTQNELGVFLSSGQVLEDVVFVSFDRRSCCAFFNNPTIKPSSTLIVGFQEVQAICIETD